jgi:TRAP-type C4-dicarboxylate transport system permease small subunit
VVTIALLVALAIVVVLAVGFRYAGHSLVWYDEVASVMLAWVTYYGAALAAVRRRHFSFPGLTLALPMRFRAAVFVSSEAVVYAVFAIMAWYSWDILRVMAGDTLVSLDWISLQVTQSAVPIGCALFIAAQMLSTPDAWARIVAGRSAEADEIDDEIAKAPTGPTGGSGQS